MRIRRRPPLPLSFSQTPNFSPQIKFSNTGEGNAVHPNGLNNDPSLSDPIPKEEEKVVELDSSALSSPMTLGAQLHNNDRSGEEIEKNANTVKDEVMIEKKKRAPPVLMEGSRCSRVNGRGWRCCQQTLIGYSLCDHHLGKGRLRSVNKSPRVIKNGTGKTKRKEKIGTMKARSISGMLVEADQCNGN